MKSLKSVFVGLALSAVAVLSGCATAPDLLNKANFTEIQQNKSTQAEVESFIGKPDSKLADMWIYQRPQENITVLIDFDSNGRVTRKQWINGVDGDWDDTNKKP